VQISRPKQSPTTAVERARIDPIARIPWFIVHPMIKMLSSESPAGPNTYAQPLDQRTS
jgi:hypothetical protein